jgi:DNA-binding LacI/PurR family transcriptional regulator
MPPSVREIAEFVGVSKSTVSLALNNKAGVSSAMRQLILSAIAELEQRQGQADALKEPDTGALSTYRTTDPTVSIVILHPPVLRSSYVFSEVLRGIQSAAEVYHAELRLISNEPLASAQHVAHLYFSDPTLRPDGVIVFGAKQEEPLIEAARALAIPCVVLGREPGKYAVSGVGRREDIYAYQAAQHLIQLGHRAVGFLGGDAAYDYVHNRVEGYRRALIEAGLQPKPNWIQLGQGGAALEQLLQHAPEVTGVLFVNDSYTAEALPVIERLGLQIPKDLSLVSFDDTEVARQHTPPISSVSYRRFEEGQWAVKMLLEQLRNPYIEAVHTLFKGELIVRESSAPPRQ